MGEWGGGHRRGGSCRARRARCSLAPCTHTLPTADSAASQGAAAAGPLRDLPGADRGGGRPDLPPGLRGPTPLPRAFPFFLPFFVGVYIYVCMRLLSVVVGWGLVGCGLWGSFLRCSTLPLLLSRPTTTTHNYNQKQQHHQANCINSWLERNATCPTCRKGATKCVVSIISLPPVLFCPFVVSCRFVLCACTFTFASVGRSVVSCACRLPHQPPSPHKNQTPPPSIRFPFLRRMSESPGDPAVQYEGLVAIVKTASVEGPPQVNFFADFM